MQLSQIQTAVKRYGFDATDPLTDWINQALHEFEDAFPWPWLEARTTVTTTIGSNTIALPADFYKLMSLKIDSYPMRPEYVDLGTFEDETDDTTIQGLPNIFTLVGLNQLLMWPTPDQVYTLRLVYRKFVPDLVNATDVPAIPTRHHYLLVKGASMLGLQTENNEYRAQSAQAQWEAGILRAISRFATKQEMEADEVRDTQGYFERQF